MSKAKSKPVTDRLTLDGASSQEKIRKRLRWLAHEWSIAPSELPTVGRTASKELVDFGQKYAINWDWLLCGDLEGLRKMLRERKQRTSPDLHVDLGRLIGRLQPHQLRAAVECLRAIAEPGQ